LSTIVFYKRYRCAHHLWIRKSLREETGIEALRLTAVGIPVQGNPVGMDSPVTRGNEENTARLLDMGKGGSALLLPPFPILF
jgi:hypothetical protein